MWRVYSRRNGAGTGATWCVAAVLVLLPCPDFSLRAIFRRTAQTVEVGQTRLRPEPPRTRPAVAAKGGRSRPPTQTRRHISLQGRTQISIANYRDGQTQDRSPRATFGRVQSSFR